MAEHSPNFLNRLLSFYCRLLLGYWQLVLPCSPMRGTRVAVVSHPTGLCGKTSETLGLGTKTRKAGGQYARNRDLIQFVLSEDKTM